MLENVGQKEGGFALQYFLFGETGRLYYYSLNEGEHQTFRVKFLRKESYDRWPVYEEGIKRDAFNELN